MPRRVSTSFASFHGQPSNTCQWRKYNHALTPKSARLALHAKSSRRAANALSDVSPWISLALVGGALAIVSAIALHLLKTGYKIRH